MIEKIYVVTGPDAQHADGSGPLFYTDDEDSARWYITEEKKTVEELRAEGSNELPWPYNTVDFNYHSVDGSVQKYFEIPDDIWQSGSERILEWLNEQ